MAGGSKKKKPKRTLFEQIRKPSAPPSRKMGERKPEEKIYPAGRSKKHKQKDSDNADI